MILKTKERGDAPQLERYLLSMRDTGGTGKRDDLIFRQLEGASHFSLVSVRFSLYVHDMFRKVLDPVEGCFVIMLGLKRKRWFRLHHSGVAW